MDKCPHIFHREELMPEGDKHYSKVVCDDCAAFIRWLPFPTGLESVVVPECEDGPLPELRGSPAQIKWALVLRSRLLQELERTLDSTREPKKLLWAAQQIQEASWWIANRDMPAADVRWPLAWMPKSAVSSPTRVKERAPRHVAESVRGFDVSTERVDGDDGAPCCVLRVTFDGGRSSGSLTMKLEEVEKVERALLAFLRRHRQTRNYEE